jgi:hypothetical protein
MHFNSANFAACKILFVVYVVNMAVFNNRENSTQMTNNSSLTTIMNITAEHPRHGSSTAMPTCAC